MKENYDDIYDNDYINLKNDNIEDIFNIDIKSTSNESENNENYNNEDYKSDDEIDLKYDNYGNSLEENIQKNYKNFQNIVCSECGEIPYIEIDHINYRIKSSCLNGHNKVDTFINFIKKSNEKVAKGYECIECKKEISELNIKKNNRKNNIFKCTCNNYVCNDCKEEHKRKEYEGNAQEFHNFVQLSEKDYKCACSGEPNDFIAFCTKCNKNLCSNCQSNHSSEHNELLFTEEDMYDLDVEKKKQEFEKQKSNIKEFLDKLNNLKKDLFEKIRELEKNLELYIEINDFIIYKYNIAFLNDQVIENFRNINFKLEDKLDIFKTYTNFKDSLVILSSLFYDKKVTTNYSIGNEALRIRRASLSDITSLTTYKQEDLQISSDIKCICELNNKILVGDGKGQIHIFNLSDKEYKETYIINLNEEIKFLYSLTNKYFVASDENKIIIYGLKENKNLQKHIINQEFEYTFKTKNNSKIKISKQSDIRRSNKIINNIFNKNKINNINKLYYQIIELQNNYLIYIDGDKIIVLEPNFNKTYKKIGKGIYLKCNIVSMTEINNNKFCVYSENNYISIFNSHNFEEIDKIDNLGFPFKKIEALSNDIIVCFGQEIMLISISQKKLINCKLSNYTDMCCEPHKVLLVKKNKLSQYSLESTKKDINLSKVKEMDIVAENSTIINSLYISKNNKKETTKGKLILVYNNKKFKMYLNNPNIFDLSNQ